MCFFQFPQTAVICRSLASLQRARIGCSLKLLVFSTSLLPHFLPVRQGEGVLHQGGVLHQIGVCFASKKGCVLHLIGGCIESMSCKSRISDDIRACSLKSCQLAPLPSSPSSSKPAAVFLQPPGGAGALQWSWPQKVSEQKSRHSCQLAPLSSSSSS